jgi:hypothetical protein
VMTTCDHHSSRSPPIARITLIGHLRAMSCDELTVRLDGSPPFAPDGGLRFHPCYQKQAFTCARLETRTYVWPGEEQFLLLLRQHLLNIPSQQALKLSAQPALKRTL